MPDGPDVADWRRMDWISLPLDELVNLVVTEEKKKKSDICDFNADMTETVNVL